MAVLSLTALFLRKSSSGNTTTTTTTTAAPKRDVKVTLWGDANCDKSVNMADAVLVMQSILNGDEFGLGKPDGITEVGAANADVYETGDGLTNSDALTIQEFSLDIIKELPLKSAAK